MRARCASDRIRAAASVLSRAFCRAGRGHAAVTFGLGRPGTAGASARGHRRPGRRASELAGTLVLADPQGYVRCSPTKGRPWLPCSGRWLRSTGTGSPPPGRCPLATSQPSCGHARPPAGNVDRLRRPNRNSRPARAAHRLRNSKGSGGINKARAAASFPRQVAHKGRQWVMHITGRCAPIRSHRQRDTSPSRFGREDMARTARPRHPGAVTRRADGRPGAQTRSGPYQVDVTTLSLGGGRDCNFDGVTPGTEETPDD